MYHINQENTTTYFRIYLLNKMEWKVRSMASKLSGPLEPMAVR